MDLNATLRRIRTILAKYPEPLPGDTEWEEAMEELADLTRALDEWLTGGGFLPIEWHLVRDNKRFER